MSGEGSHEVPSDFAVLDQSAALLIAIEWWSEQLGPNLSPISVSYSFPDFFGELSLAFSVVVVKLGNMGDKLDPALFPLALGLIVNQEWHYVFLEGGDGKAIFVVCLV